MLPAISRAACPASSARFDNDLEYFLYRPCGILETSWPIMPPAPVEMCCQAGLEGAHWSAQTLIRTCERRIRSAKRCILVHNDASGNMAVLQGFTEFAVKGLSAAYRLVRSQSQYGSGKSEELLDTTVYRVHELARERGVEIGASVEDYHRSKESTAGLLE